MQKNENSYSDDLFLIETNQVFKSILHLTGLSQNKSLVQKIFKMGGQDVSVSQIDGWRRSPAQDARHRMKRQCLNNFLNGLFEYRDTKSSECIEVFNFEEDMTFILGPSIK